MTAAELFEWHFARPVEKRGGIQLIPRAEFDMLAAFADVNGLPLTQRGGALLLGTEYLPEPLS